MKKNEIMILAILSILTSSIIAVANPNSEQSSMVQNLTQVTVESGKLISAMDIQNIPEVPTIKNRTIPIMYAIPNDEMDKLKKQPFSAIGNQPETNIDSTSINAPALISGFEGIDNELNIIKNGYTVRPADSNTAAGPYHIGTVTNDIIRFSSKAGSTVFTVGTPSWFSKVFALCANCFVTDPKIEYDPVAGHWIILVLGEDFTNPSAKKGRYLISVSQTSDPTKGWFFYNINGDVFIDGVNTFPDYPELGRDYNKNSGAIYVTSNNFDSSGKFHTSVLNILNKSALYQGKTFSFWQFDGLTDSNGQRSFTVNPVQTLSQVTTTNTPIEYMVNTKEISGNFASLWKVIPAFPPISPKISRYSISIGSYSPPPNAVEPCGAKLDTIDNRIYNSIFRNGHVYAGFNDAFNFGSGTVSAVRLFDINTNTLSASQDIRFGANGYYYWFPAITTDTNNNIIFVFARTSPSVLAELRYTGKKTTDTTVEPSVLLKGGQECITGFRWGDYFGVGNDPVNTNRVWIYGEYSKADGISTDWDWGTFVGQVSN